MKNNPKVDKRKNFSWQETHVFINSEILAYNGEKTFFQEGCLSLPGIALDVERPEKVVLKYQSFLET